MKHQPEHGDDVVAQRVENYIRTAGHWAGRIAAGATIAYGAFIAIDGLIGSAEEVARANNLGTTESAWVTTAHDVTDAVTPDFVTDPIRSGIDPGWQPAAELGAGLLIGYVAGMTLRDAVPELDR